MKIIATTFLILTAAICLAQSVTTLTNVTANGGITLDTFSNLYVAHFGPLPPNSSIGKHIYKVTPTGDVDRIVDGVLSVGSGNSYHSSGSLYQSNFNTNNIIKFDLEGNILDATFATVSGPVGITEGPDENLYICSCNLGQVRKIEPDGTNTIFASSPLFNCANGITFAGDGNFYATNFSDGRIIKITQAGVASLLGSTPVGNGHITYRANDQHLYIASYTGNRIYKMDLSGNEMLIAGTGAVGANNSENPLMATFANPNGIEISTDGCSLYISQDLNVLREIKFTDGSCSSGVGTFTDDESIDVYPNPTKGLLNIDNPNNLEFTQVTILDSTGRKVMTTSFNKELDVSSIAPGQYSILLTSTRDQVYSRIVVIN